MSLLVYIDDRTLHTQTHISHSMNAPREAKVRLDYKKFNSTGEKARKEVNSTDDQPPQDNLPEDSLPDSLNDSLNFAFNTLSLTDDEDLTLEANQ